MIAERIELALSEVVPFNLEQVEGGRRGTCITGAAGLEIMGTDDRPTEATLFVEVPPNSPVIVAQGAAMLVQFLQASVPEWLGSQEWLNRELTAATSETRFTKFRHEFTMRKMNGGVFLTIAFPPS